MTHYNNKNNYINRNTINNNYIDRNNDINRNNNNNNDDDEFVFKKQTIDKFDIETQIYLTRLQYKYALHDNKSKPKPSSKSWRYNNKKGKNNNNNYDNNNNNKYFNKRTKSALPGRSFTRADRFGRRIQLNNIISDNISSLNHTPRIQSARDQRSLVSYRSPYKKLNINNTPRHSEFKPINNKKEVTTSVDMHDYLPRFNNRINKTQLDHYGDRKDVYDTSTFNKIRPHTANFEIGQGHITNLKLWELKQDEFNQIGPGSYDNYKKRLHHTNNNAKGTPIIKKNIGDMIKHDRELDELSYGGPLLYDTYIPSLSSDTYNPTFTKAKRQLEEKHYFQFNIEKNKNNIINRQKQVTMDIKNSIKNKKRELLREKAKLRDQKYTETLKRAVQETDKRQNKLQIILQRKARIEEKKYCRNAQRQWCILTQRLNRLHFWCMTKRKLDNCRTKNSAAVIIQMAVRRYLQKKNTEKRRRMFRLIFSKYFLRFIISHRIQKKRKHAAIISRFLIVAAESSNKSLMGLLRTVKHKVVEIQNCWRRYRRVIHDQIRVAIIQFDRFNKKNPDLKLTIIHNLLSLRGQEESRGDSHLADLIVKIFAYKCGLFTFLEELEDQNATTNKGRSHWATNTRSDLENLVRKRRIKELVRELSQKNALPSVYSKRRQFISNSIKRHVLGELLFKKRREYHREMLIYHKQYAAFERKLKRSAQYHIEVARRQITGESKYFQIQYDNFMRSHPHPVFHIILDEMELMHCLKDCYFRQLKNVYLELCGVATQKYKNSKILQLRNVVFARHKLPNDDN